MKVSTRTRYGLRAMLELALVQGKGPFYAVECLEDKSYCDRYADCVAREVWTRVQDAIKDVLGSVTLADMAESVKSGKKQTITYQI